MSHPLKLEVFETPDALVGPSLMMPEDIEDIRLNAYEKGYVAGWEDNGKQADADEATRRAAIERQVEQLSFTYHEARGHVLKSIEPLLGAMVETLLPALVKSTIVPLTIEQLLPLAHAASEQPLTLRVGLGCRDAFEDALKGQMLPPLELVETADLAEGQAEFVMGVAETRIDLTHAAETIGRAIDRFYQIQTEENLRA
ncbi:hypothetical protein [Pararhodobacter sp. CCB-MM2]|uniref:hypothetical protein n=1 Tax=Pararhodobacter sp. CCB-MM2 TaxID=1786003 RepID=UPI00082D4239|nr:hypothetical protein [Pararhodobacter sp. CCB-MM2]MCA2014429.1 hypothetical protein [Cereibacter sphaeroides]